MHQGLPLTLYLHKIVERIDKLAKLISTNEAKDLHGVATTIRTYVKSAILALDLVREYPCITSDDYSILLDTKSKLDSMIKALSEVRLSGYEAKMLSSTVRHLKWLLNRINDLKVTPIDRRAQAFCLQAYVKP